MHMFQMTKKQRVVKVLRRAAAALKKYGWIKDDEGDTEMGFCATGALSHVSKNRRTQDLAHMALAYSIKGLDNSTLSHTNASWRVQTYNDKKRRHKSEVLRLFKRVSSCN